VCSLLGAREARADGLPVSAGASFGWAEPLGSAARGARLRDTTFGTVPLGLDASYRLLPALGVVAHGQYGFGVPTLCQTAADCTASLGTDIELDLAIRWHLPRFGPTASLVDVGMGYEWFTARLVDAGAHSTRSYRGPVLLSAALAAPFRLSTSWTIGPVIGLWAGTFTAQSLEANTVSSSDNVPGRTVHAWLRVGVRLEFSLRTKLGQ
jgi:hypothetical protein